MCLGGSPTTPSTREYWRAPDDRPPAPQNGHKMNTNSVKILPDLKNPFLFEAEPLLDADFDGLEDVLAEDLIAELGNDGRGICPSGGTY